MRVLQVIERERFELRCLLAVAFTAATVAQGDAEAHGGGLDAAGCHHRKATGEYHCHRAPLPRMTPDRERVEMAPPSRRTERAPLTALPAATVSPSTGTAARLPAVPPLPDTPAAFDRTQSFPRQPLANCRNITEPSKRLWCYDEFAAQEERLGAQWEVEGGARDVRPSAIDRVTDSEPIHAERYSLQVSREATKDQRYPRRAQMLGWQGTTEVSVLAGGDGLMKDAAVLRSSGYAILDEEAIAKVRRMRSLPAIPEEMKGREFRVTVPILFKLE